eukprot:TRINITY_DN114471_c0_g1_i1.p3 TRINITY_DN114471_c0_g1~~TRINITY_DN114471_c0_g1_i1.p3  ORF type:complete len:199 (-),score=79.77 TRINITY_DN114471_c0_g1_i1:46-642(-)
MLRCFLALAAAASGVLQVHVLAARVDDVEDGRKQDEVLQRREQRRSKARSRAVRTAVKELHAAQDTAQYEEAQAAESEALKDAAVAAAEEAQQMAYHASAEAALASEACEERQHQLQDARRLVGQERRLANNAHEDVAKKAAAALQLQQKLEAAEQAARLARQVAKAEDDRELAESKRRAARAEAQASGRAQRALPSG